MADELNALLQPSLQSLRPRRSPYSLRAQFLTAFLGGPLAIIGMAALNAHRLDRWRKDALWLVPLLATYVAVATWLSVSEPGQAVWAMVKDTLGPRPARPVNTAAALAVFAITAAVHRRSHQAAEMFGLKPPSPWIAGIGLSVLAFAAAMLWVFVLA